jgi:hypothetical protein
MCDCEERRRSVGGEMSSKVWGIEMEVELSMKPSVYTDGFL